MNSSSCERERRILQSYVHRYTYIYIYNIYIYHGMPWYQFSINGWKLERSSKYMLARSQQRDR